MQRTDRFAEYEDRNPDTRDMLNIVKECRDINDHCGGTMTRTGDVATKLELICAYAERMIQDA